MTDELKSILAGFQALTESLTATVECEAGG